MATDGFEMLEVNEYAKRLCVSRAIVFEWMKRGILTPEEHFLKTGRILRFLWSEQVIKSLMNSAAQAEKSSLPVPEKSPAPRSVSNKPMHRSNSTTGSPINSDYFKD